MGYEVKLAIFEGPLDLLLYLIKKNEIDIYDIPIALITEQYLTHVEMMKSLNLDVAGEYLVLAATLIHIKSKMLLPSPEENIDGEEDEADPRSELVKQLLEYEVFKDAAMQLGQRPLLERDVFTRAHSAEDKNIDEGRDEIEIDLSVFDLVEAFYRIISTMAKTELMEIDVEKMSLSERMNEIMDRLTEKKKMTFTELMGGQLNRRMILYTFLAILELIKVRMIRVYQAGSFGVIRIALVTEK
jgi:segregation and condensation protein A